MNIIKNYLVAGILVWVPIGVTVWIIHFIFQMVNIIVPPQLSSQTLFGVNVPGSDLLLVIIVLLITGMIAKNFFGQKFINLSHTLISHIPIVKSIFNGVKQVSDTLLSEQGMAFRETVLVRFPHHEVWSIAFITGETNPVIMEEYAEYINVFVPTAPNPTSGYCIMVRKQDVRKLNMSVDTALRYVISMGTITPTAKIIKKVIQ